MWSLSQLRKQMNSWWIITCISRPCKLGGGNQNKPPNHLPCFCFRTSVRSFLLVSCFPLSWSLSQQPQGSVLGRRMTQDKRKINLGQPELSWTCSLKTNPQAQLNVKAGQKLAKISIFSSLQDQWDYQSEVLGAALTIRNQRRAQTCKEVTLAGWQNSLADSRKCNFYK